MGDKSPKTLAWYKGMGVEPQKGMPILCEFDKCNNMWPYGGGAIKRKRFCSRACKDKYRPEKDYGPSDFDFIKFLASGKTRREIAKRFHLTNEQINQRLSRDYPNFELYQTRNHFQEEIYVFLPIIKDEIEVKPKVWKYTKQVDGQPYLWIKFPKLKHKKLNIVPLSDIHRGAISHYKEKFEEYVNWIAENDDVYVFINGDVIENTLGETLKGKAIFDQEYHPRTQREEMTRILSRIAHKILWAIPGNHEDRSRKYNFDPLEWICDALDIPYFDEPIYVDILWNGYLFDFWAQHGVTNAQTEGGKINAAKKPTQWQEFCMFTIMGHVHDSKVDKFERVCRDRINFELKFKKQYLIICPGFMKYFGSYAARRGMPPGAVGAVRLEIYANGDYHASS